MKKSLLLILILALAFPFSAGALSKKQRAKIALIGGIASLVAGIGLMCKNGTIKIPDFKNNALLSWYPETENSWIAEHPWAFWPIPLLVFGGLASLVCGLIEIGDSESCATDTNGKQSNTDLICHGPLNVNGPMNAYILGPNVHGDVNSTFSPNITNYE